MTLLDVQDACAAPWGEALLENITIALPAGQILGVTGPNGAGKTSLLHLLAGAVPVTSGQVLLNGLPLAQLAPLSRARQLAVLPQQSPLEFPFLVEQVVLLGRTPHETGSEEDRFIAERTMAATDVLNLRHRPYTQLSGGEKQRVQLARVLAQVDGLAGSPRLLLLDEPTAALDLQHQKLVAGILQSLSNDGCAVVIVMHDFNLLASVADQLLVLRAGQVAAQGSPAEVLTPDVFSEVFNVEVAISAHPSTGKPMVVTL